MTQPGVVSERVTLCADVYDPGAGLNVGLAAAGSALVVVTSTARITTFRFAGNVRLLTVFALLIAKV
jgi:hypothetical protein